ncbi:lipocalin-like domain-containing protein [Nocardiopsis valliformis]|uniref:lipocalin-like domain-containing protein n=1 Tax=Nocardiopsis valliformis TaxID=239974 RepID=UPI00034B82F2|nr:lipocalin-like domain-containing protein [Nocardiopsis valliformis]
MKKELLFASCALGLLVFTAGCAQAAEPVAEATNGGAGQAGEDDELMGVWRMTSLEAGEEGDLQEVPYSGEIAFASESVSVQAMNPDSEAPDTAYTVEGYEAFYGALTVDSDAGTFEVDVESALARDLIGETLTRNYEVAEDTLVLTPTDSSEGWRVTYERLSE